MTRRRHNLIPHLLVWCLLVVGTALAQPPVINEFMAANATTIADDDGDHSDWIELYNSGATAYDLTGHYLSDTADEPLRWQFPAATIPATGYLLVWASGKDRIGADGTLHTNFAISAAGEPLLLTAADGTTRLDEVAPIALATDISYGRLPDGADSWVEFAVATPGATNDDGLQALAAPVFAQAPGIYPSPLVLVITTADPQAVITYTLDGSEPTPASPVYSEPLFLDDRAGDPDVFSLIRTNHRDAADHIGWRPPRDEVSKLNIVRARAYRSGHAPSRVTTGSYVISHDAAGELPLDLVSLATSPANLFDQDTGIYVPGVHYIDGDHWTGNYYETGEAWERPVHLEIFTRDGGLLLAQDAGMRIHGGVSRSFPQKSLRLHARAAYGPARFNTQLFPDLPDTSFNRFLIRNSGNDWGQRGFRDLVIHAIVADMGFDTQAGRPVVHFINGEYWGVANLRERYDRHYLERCYGIPTELAAILVNSGTIEEGTAADRLAYLLLRSYVGTHDLNQPEHLAHVAAQMDLENFIAYNVAEIYSANYDWPGNNIRFWRRSLPAEDPAPYGHDGRWRWMLYDVDHGFFSASYDMLGHAIAPNGPSWPNPPWSTALLRGLLGSDWFRQTFINTFADHLNSTFVPARLVAIIDAFADAYQPAIAAWQDRWDINYNWAGSVQSLRNFVNDRPAHQRQHLVDHFELAGTSTITVDVNDVALGRVQVNHLLIDTNLPGLDDPDQPYPWSGVYFQGVPLTITALPEPGYRLASWQGHAGDEPVLVVTPDTSPLALTAVFALEISPPVPVQAWHFNHLPDGALGSVPADQAPYAGGLISYPGLGAGYLDRVDDGTQLGALPGIAAGAALRVRNPSDTRELILALPSLYYQDLALSYAVKRTSNGAETHSVSCRTAPDGPWLAVAEDLLVELEYQLVVLDLAGIAGAAHNPDLAVKFTFGGPSASGSSGNQRFDNITLTGVRVPGVNMPPQVAQPVGLQQLVEEDEPSSLDLTAIFHDPDHEPLTYAVVSSHPQAVTGTVDGGELAITPHQRGDAWLTVSASDGHHPPVAHAFRVLVHPRAARLVDEPLAFTAWDPDLPERTYPAHMLFLQSDLDDPGPDTPLLFPYFIPHDDYHADDQGTVGFPYNNTGRTRINGLAEDGISFINTGRGRDLGGLVLAVDTRLLAEAQLAWLGGTILPNSRHYAIRLQYRLDLAEPFQDLLHEGQPIVYQRSEDAGDVQHFGPWPLPAALLDRPYVQLLWRYHHVSGTAGPRAELRLDEIHLAGTVGTTAAPQPLPTTTSLAGAAPNPFNPATEIHFSVRAGERARLDIYNSRGQRVRALGVFEPGHHRQLWDGTDERGRRCASGVYFCRLSAPTGNQTGKLLLLK
jgi:hypothetical protein